MKNLIIIVTLFLFISAINTNELPDLKKRSDLKLLGKGRIIEKDNSMVINIRLDSVSTYWVTYEKNGSSHDMMMEYIKRIEFRETPWGPISLEFPRNSPRIIRGCN